MISSVRNDYVERAIAGYVMLDSCKTVRVLITNPERCLTIARLSAARTHCAALYAEASLDRNSDTLIEPQKKNSRSDNIFPSQRLHGGAAENGQTADYRAAAAQDRPTQRPLP
jgi:hypothetical protein